MDLNDLLLELEDQILLLQRLAKDAKLDLRLKQRAEGYRKVQKAKRVVSEISSLLNELEAELNERQE
ncbi:hypothetical protein SacRon12I_02315 [Sulfolobus acidocaldarius Ron12/I]|uniref:Uncharacterized protein n=1 Tax=Sulfolobus acidocaldarius Ron12/I TaxID=1028567 RepID=M1IA83_9CREN|nr:hypothetical protein SacRon12I_02315 [Sulfolobus acidocaldarius Ron12/I]